RGQVRGANLVIALTIFAVTCGAGAIAMEDRIAALSRSGVIRLLRKRAHIFGNIADLRGRQNIVRSEARHLAGMRLIAPIADAVRDGLINGVELAAPEPNIVSEVWITLRALRVLTVASCTIIHERCPSASDGKSKQVRVRLDFKKTRFCNRVIKFG